MQGVLGSYVDALLAAGGLPVLIPVSVQGEDLRDLYARLAGVILPGGGDISPDHYHALAHPATHEMDADRDLAELWLARQALAMASRCSASAAACRCSTWPAAAAWCKTCPANCRKPRRTTFHYPDYPLDYPAHSVQVEEDSLLADCLDSPIVEVTAAITRPCARWAPACKWWAARRMA